MPHPWKAVMIYYRDGVCVWGAGVKRGQKERAGGRGKWRGQVEGGRESRVYKVCY